MNIKHRKKWRRAPWNPNIMIPYMSYYLCESYRDVSGKACKRTVLNIGELEGFSEAQIHELWKMLTEMIKTGQTVFGNSKETTELALRLYNKYRDKEKPAKTASEELAMAAEEQKEEDLRNQCWMNVDINSLRITKPRQITNMYAEGQYLESELFRYGRSKEKRDDCKVVVLAAVVNTDGLLVRTRIYEGNRADVTTVADIIGSLKLDRVISMGRSLRVVMDAGFNDDDNLKWLKEHNIDYVTVMRSRSSQKYTAKGDPILVEDCKHQPIKIQMVDLDGKDETTGGSVMLVDSDAKALKERSMLTKASDRLEADLNAVKAAIEGKGTKKRDALNRRLGRLSEKYGAVFGCYDIDVTYDEMDKATGITWKRNAKFMCREKVHGKYLLQTSLPENDPNIIWTTYNIVRTVEETFKLLKSDLDVRPIYHKTDEAAKAHLNLAVLAYWIVSVTKYKLKMKDINVRWSEILRMMSTQVWASVSMKACRKVEVTTRKDSDPEEKLMEIYNALDTTPNPRGTLISVKSVGPKIHLQKKSILKINQLHN